MRMGVCETLDRLMKAAPANDSLTPRMFASAGGRFIAAQRGAFVDDWTYLQQQAACREAVFAKTFAEALASALDVILGVKHKPSAVHAV